MIMAARAVVFAYHDVGVRCLQVLLARGVQVPLVITHRDDPAENVWFDSVASVAASHGLPCIVAEDCSDEELLARVREARPDFLFSFYYRRMLPVRLLALAPRGAFNMHGSMLPRYRGRAPVNWAVIRGETETGASLHVMEEKPDRGPVVDQLAVPILPDDTARQVFGKVTFAAETVLWRSLPALLDGTATFTPQDPAQASYFGGRRPEDGRIPPGIGAAALHDLVRGLTHPYPGAFADLPQGRLAIWRTRRLASEAVASEALATAAHAPAAATLFAAPEGLRIACSDGGVLQVTEATLDGSVLDAAAFARCFGREAVTLCAHSHMLQTQEQP